MKIIMELVGSWVRSDKQRVGVQPVRFLKNALFGLIIAVAAVTPGLSGGALAIALGLYEPMIKAISALTKEFWKNALFLLPLGVGGIVGVLVFGNLMVWLMQQAPGQVKILFLGLVAGSLPGLIRQANARGFHFCYLLLTAGAMILVYLGGSPIEEGPQVISGDLNALHYACYGLIHAVGTIVPGISSSFIFLHLGVYDDLLQAVLTVDLNALLPAGLGFALGAVLLIRLVELFFCRYYSLAYYAVLGFLLGSALLIVPSPRAGWQIIFDLCLFLLGAVFSLILLKLRNNEICENNKQA